MLKVKDSEKIYGASQVEDYRIMFKETSLTDDEPILILQTIEALVNDLPVELPLGLSVSVIFAILSRKEPLTLLRAPERMYKIIRRCILEHRSN